MNSLDVMEGFNKIQIYSFGLIVAVVLMLLVKVLLDSSIRALNILGIVLGASVILELILILIFV